ncbi:MAG TPA: response regulator [Polyangiaceae bacterium]|nr:response regulator [Polyangiaceae bacterium]
MPSPAHPSSARSASILVVDDDTMILRMTRAVLEDLGYKVTVAASGKEAIEVLEKLSSPDFDLVVLDMRMPDMDGVQVLDKTHPRWPDLRVLLVTGYSGDGILETYRSQGVVGVLEKPYDPETLADAVQRLVRK